MLTDGWNGLEKCNRCTSGSDAQGVVNVSYIRNPNVYMLSFPHESEWSLLTLCSTEAAL
jgi:hypothetical protein